MKLIFGVLPSVLRVSRRAAAITAKHTGTPAILQQDWTETGPELGPGRAVPCDQEPPVSWGVCWTERRRSSLINVFNPQQESRSQEKLQMRERWAAGGAAGGWRKETTGWASGLEADITI